MAAKKQKAYQYGKNWQMIEEEKRIVPNNNNIAINSNMDINNNCKVLNDRQPSFNFPST